MKILIALGLMFLTACAHDHDHGADGAHAGHDDHEGGGGHGHGTDHGREAVSFTRWTEQTELFVEFPVLVVGADSSFAAHLTRLSDFQPVADGEVTVRLSGGGAGDEQFTVSAASVPGIFRPIARPSHAGRRKVEVLVESTDLTDVHDLGEMTVFADEAAAAAADSGEADAEGSISFLKEQQWPIEFATEDVVERTLRPSVRLNGTLRARADGEAWVTAPVSGRLMGVDDDFPRIGMSVDRGDVLALVTPRLGPESDVASLELAVERARLELEQARRERKRLEGLLSDGAVPERRVLEARNEEQQVEARQQAAERRLRQHKSVQEAGRIDAGDGTAVPAPIAGTVAAVTTAPGQFVEDGEELFHLVDLDRLWLEVRVPEATVADLQHPGGAWFEVEGFDQIFDVPANRVLAVGGVVDAATRTIPLLFDVPNPERTLRVGMFARVHVLTGNPRRGLAIPVQAVIWDEGMDTVYVQVGGESFDRRIVRLGARDRRYVEVLAGLSSGDRVVTRGAYAVKLAAAGTQVPAHGHAH